MFANAHVIDILINCLFAVRTFGVVMWTITFENTAQFEMHITSTLISHSESKDNRIYKRR